MKSFISVVMLLAGTIGFAQNSFNYDVLLEPVQVSGLSGLHSFVFAQHNGKWLVMSGRKDGIHARQPFNTFPVASSNTDIYVIDVNEKLVWSTSLSSLSTSLQEQLQSTNLNFIQDADTLYITGGYGFSATSNSFKTFPHLVTVQVSSLINSIMNSQPIPTHFKQTTDTIFALTGAQLGKIGNEFYLVGGHRFEGRYNPMGPTHGPGFTQVYSPQIRKFTVNNTATLSYQITQIITDPVHLRRRDYNLVPQVFANGQLGYIISSGVFQPTADLPFLYPVEISAAGYTPITSFNQYLSNYHSAKSALYDSISNEMHMLFFGGISQYYYQNGQLMQDNTVPFVKTISLLTRSANGSYQEYNLPVEMPALKGASAEFIPNQAIAHIAPQEIVELHKITSDTILLGHIYGGIHTPINNAFTTNQTNQTSADASIYAVKLVRNASISLEEVDGNHGFEVRVSPNPATDSMTLSYNLNRPGDVYYTLTTADGRVLLHGKVEETVSGENITTLHIPSGYSGAAVINVSYLHKYHYSQKVIIK